MTNKKIVLTGIKPTGEIHLGNFIGAIKPALELAHDSQYKNYLFVADYHAFTVMHDPAELKHATYSVAATWLALGLDPDKICFYRQSDVPQIMELNWILTCMTSKGLMNRAHAYKALTQANEEAGREDLDHNIGMGIYSYPILMAADILCFDANFVPVGRDQVQHIEIARDIAQRLNHHMKNDVLILPDAMVPTVGHSVPGLDGRKMSKSYNNSIPLFVPEKKLRKLIMKIATDSTPPEAPKDPNTSTIFDIYSALASETEIKALAQHYQRGIGWGEAKQVLFEKVNEVLAPCRERYEYLMSNTDEIDTILAKGAEEAKAKAQEVLDRVKKSIGIS